MSSIERDVVRKDDKLLIQASRNKEETDKKEVILRSKDFKGEPEQVRVSVGLTLSPRQFESIRIDYACTIHHDPGLEKRDEAFDVAKFHCLERLVDDVEDLHKVGIIKDHFLAADDEEEEA